ncbi:MAG TPA: hypothetical protein VFJ07_06275 [Streptosporangiaceae bacterium]|nr:hypothetical protein [Streptosporangiaceae bacterium]
MILGVTRRIAARWAGVAALIVGVAAVAAAPAGAAAGQGPAPARPALPAFPAGVWRPADSSGVWGPLKAAAAGPARGLPAPPAGQPSSGGPWRLQRSPNPVIHNGMLVADSCTGRGICTAVGGYENRSGTQVPLAEARAGTGWRMRRAPVPAGAVLSNLFGVSCTAADACTAVGYYTDAALHIRPLAERWNGTSWAIQPVPGPAGFPEAGFFAVSCASARACTAVGARSSSTGATTPLAGRWNGTSWAIQPVPGPAGSLASELLAVSCPTATACTAGGSEINAAQKPVPLAEGWNGTRWSVQPVPSPAGAIGAGFSGLSCSTPATCTAAGSYGDSSGASVLLAEAWNGTRWRIQATPSPAGSTGSEFLAVSCSAAAACTAVGATTISTQGGRIASGGTSTTVSLAERWNGTNWRIQATPGPGRSVGAGLAAVSCSAATACTAAGSYDTTSHLARATAAAWGGGTWHRQATPSPAGASVSSGLIGVSCASARACTAAGFGTGTTGDSAALTERWDGTRWLIQPSPVPPGTVSATLNGVSCSAPRTCTAVGEYFSAGQRELALAERWSGGQSRLQQFPRPPATAQGGELSGVSCPAAASCFAAGWYFTKSGSAAFTATWNGARWRVQPAPGPAHAGHLLGVSCGSPRACVAVGDHGTAVWNGTGWRYAAVAAPAGAQALTLNGVSCTSASACAAVGSYFSPAGGPLTLAETWNGSAWLFQPSPSPAAQGRNQLNTVSCTAPSACTAVGVEAASDFAPPGAFAETWDGTKWRLQPVPAPAGTVLSELFGVSCPAPGSCTAVGDTAGQSMIGVTLAMTTAGS